jgi:hypothetical protein
MRIDYVVLMASQTDLVSLNALRQTIRYLPSEYFPKHCTVVLTHGKIVQNRILKYHHVTHHQPTADQPSRQVTTQRALYDELTQVYEHLPIRMTNLTVG